MGRGYHFKRARTVALQLQRQYPTWTVRELAQEVAKRAAQEGFAIPQDDANIHRTVRRWLSAAGRVVPATRPGVYVISRATYERRVIDALERIADALEGR